MAYSILDNKYYGPVKIICTSNSTVTISGDSSDICQNDENIIGGTISKIIVNTISGNAAYCKISRGSNTIFVADSSCDLDFKGNGINLSLDYSATLKIDFFNGTGIAIIEMLKIIDYSNNVIDSINNIVVDRNSSAIITRNGEYILAHSGNNIDSINNIVVDRNSSAIITRNREYIVAGHG